MLKHGSLFSGIGGFDLAAEWMGWENIFHCEWNEFGQRILKYYWPKAISYADITKTDFTIHRGTIDVLTGGFPCQPYSVAGKRLGKEDERHLWPEMLRAIREIQPRWVVGENVRGIINWDGGLVFHEVQTDLETEGYEVQPFLLPAAGVNAPHERYRTWFVAYASSNGHEPGRYSENRFKKGASESIEEERKWIRENAGGVSEQGLITNPFESRLPFRNDNRKIGAQGESFTRGKSSRTLAKTDWSEFPTQPPVCFRNDGFPSGLDGITFSNWRKESIKAGGNAIVPHEAHQIFKAILEIETSNIN